MTENQRSLKSESLALRGPDMPMFFLNSTGAEEISASGTSYLNRTEAGAGHLDGVPSLKENFGKHYCNILIYIYNIYIYIIIYIYYIYIL